MVPQPPRWISIDYGFIFDIISRDKADRIPAATCTSRSIMARWKFYFKGELIRDWSPSDDQFTRYHGCVHCSNPTSCPSNFSCYHLISSAALSSGRRLNLHSRSFNMCFGNEYLSAPLSEDRYNTCLIHCLDSGEKRPSLVQ